MWLTRETRSPVVMVASVFVCLCLGRPALGMPKGLAAKMGMKFRPGKRPPARPPAAWDRPSAGKAKAVRPGAPNVWWDIEIRGHFLGRHWWRAGHARQAVLDTRASDWHAPQHALKFGNQGDARGWQARRGDWRLTTGGRMRFGLPAEALMVQSTGNVRNKAAEAADSSHRAIVRHLFAPSATPSWVQTTVVFDQELTPLGHLAVTTGRLADYHAWLGYQVSRSVGNLACWFYRPPWPGSAEHSKQQADGAAGRIAQGTWSRFELTPDKHVKQTHAFEAGLREGQHWQKLRPASFGPVRIPELPSISAGRPLGLNTAADIIDALGPSSLLEQTMGPSPRGK